jgi:hypothetical protein
MMGIMIFFLKELLVMGIMMGMMGNKTFEHIENNKVQEVQVGNKYNLA